MALVSVRKRLDPTAEHGHGIPAFDANNLEHSPMLADPEEAAQFKKPVVCP